MPAMALDTLQEEAREQLPAAIRLRRDLHRRPEIGNLLPHTRERLLEELDGLGLDLTLHEQTSGVTGLLTGAEPGPTILLRGDMDALPMPEHTGLDFASEIDGAMHACGHDTHVAMLTGAARLLVERRDQLTGRVLFMFQPGEEGHHGARFMLDEGLLDVPPLSDGTESPVDAAAALHISSALPTGWVSTRRGAIMASSDVLHIVVTGRGGHASEPHRALDPVPVACEIVQAIQTMITRRIDVFDPAVVTIASIHSGTTNNVIPDRADILGTIRTVSDDARSRVIDGVRRVADGIAAAHEAEATVEIGAGYPVTANDQDFTTSATEVAREVVGAEHTVVLSNPVMGAEDFSYVLQKVPGTMLFLGGTPEGTNPRTAPANHSTKVFFEETAMVQGIALYAALALRHLGMG
jgi:hippurate hydrolase